MINIIFASHGGFAQGLLDGALMITGDTEGVCALGLFLGDDIEEYNQILSRKPSKWAAKKGC